MTDKVSKQDKRCYTCKAIDKTKVMAIVHDDYIELFYRDVDDKYSLLEFVDTKDMSDEERDDVIECASEIFIH